VTSNISAGANLQSPRWPAARSCHEEDLSEEAAPPGQPERANALRETLQQFTLENCRNRWSAAMFQQTFRTSNVSLEALCFNGKLAAIENQGLVVQKLWRKESFCGRFWKTWLDLTRDPRIYHAETETRRKQESRPLRDKSRSRSSSRILCASVSAW
jgi:hypothetical protein